MNLQDLRRYISNIPGWSTRQKIVVIESDDWGSIYMSTNKAFDALSVAGFDFSDSHYLNNDALESNDDLELLYDVLTRYKDASGRSIVMTGVNVVANPDFEKMKANGFARYEYEPYTETCKRYIGRDRVDELWKEGIRKRLFVPIFHGREHLNVQRWMRLLQVGNKSTLLAFDHEVSAFSRGLNGEQMPDLRAAFDIDTNTDIAYLREVIVSGLDLFERLYGFRSRYFVPTNGPFNVSLEPLLKECGVEFIGTGKVHIEPLGDNHFKKHYRSLGKKNEYGQRYLTRNCFFEPNSWEHDRNKDWVESCMKEIEIAFRCFKPATISSHRTNYTGSLNEKNRAHGLKELNRLLASIVKKWPDVVFLTSEELGDLLH